MSIWASLGRFSGGIISKISSMTTSPSVSLLILFLSFRMVRLVIILVVSSLSGVDLNFVIISCVSSVFISF